MAGCYTEFQLCQYPNYRADLRICPDGRFSRSLQRATLMDSGRGTCHMTFKVGDTVVYPHHGAALIEAIETRQIKGVDKTYLVLKVAQGDLTVRVPADNAEFVGVRDVVGQDGLDRVFEVLRAPYAAEPTNEDKAEALLDEVLAS